MKKFIRKNRKKRRYIRKTSVTSSSFSLSKPAFLNFIPAFFLIIAMVISCFVLVSQIKTADLIQITHAVALSINETSDIFQQFTTILLQTSSQLLTATWQGSTTAVSVASTTSISLINSVLSIIITTIQSLWFTIGAVLHTIDIIFHLIIQGLTQVTITCMTTATSFISFLVQSFINTSLVIETSIITTANAITQALLAFSLLVYHLCITIVMLIVNGIVYILQFTIHTIIWFFEAVWALITWPFKQIGQTIHKYQPFFDTIGQGLKSGIAVLQTDHLKQLISSHKQ